MKAKEELYWLVRVNLRRQAAVGIRHSDNVGSNLSSLLGLLSSQASNPPLREGNTHILPATPEEIESFPTVTKNLLGLRLIEPD